MELRLSPQDEAFREEARAFIDARLSRETRRKVEAGLRLEKHDYVDWQRALYRQCWIAPGWPVEHGGTGWSAVRRYVFEQELARAHAPPVIQFGLGMVGPVLIEYGTDEQNARYLPRILASEDWWCQGYSEPNAGSDLASLATSAERDGDHYRVNGSKIWTTHAQWADLMFCLVRTDSSGRKQEGISFLLVDMRTPGLTVRPIRTFDGGADINQVFLDDVRVRAANLVGEEGKGWSIAKFLLGHERTNMPAAPRCRAWLERVRLIASQEPCGDGTLIDDPHFRRKLAQIDVDLMALESTVLRVLSAESAGRKPGPESSILKIKGTEVQQAITELAFEAVGQYAAPYLEEALCAGWNEPPVGPEYAAPVAPRYFNWRKASIYGGSNEIQRNIIAKAVLGF